MPFNGAGAYSLPAGSIVADGTSIDAADHNTPLLDIETALSATILRNAAAPFTGNQSMGNNKLVNLADGTVATDAATLRQAQSGVASVATAVGGTANAVTLTFSPPFATYVNNMTVGFRIGTTNTGAVTVNVDGLGAKSFRKDASGTIAELISGEAQAGMFVEARFNTAADCFVWVNQKPVFLGSGGAIGIGTASPQQPLHVEGTIRIQGDSSRQQYFNSAPVYVCEAGIGVLTADLNSFGIVTRTATGSLSFGTNLTERLRITAAGVSLFSTTSELVWNGSNGAGAAIYPDGFGAFVRPNNPAGVFRRLSSNGNAVVFGRDATDVGSISVTGTSTAYNTSSDYRLKENFTPVTGALTRCNSLPVWRFNFIGDDKTFDGFKAHEAQLVVPEAVTGHKDEVDENGNPVYQGIDQSKLVPLLFAAVQELSAQVTSLTARVAALEAGQP
jgi:hypothetical protein